jgi:hypothetical protein
LVREVGLGLMASASLSMKACIQYRVGEGGRAAQVGKCMLAGVLLLSMLAGRQVWL